MAQRTTDPMATVTLKLVHNYLTMVEADATEAAQAAERIRGKVQALREQVAALTMMLEGVAEKEAPV